MTDNSKAIKIRKISPHSEWQQAQAPFRTWVLLTLCWQRTEQLKPPARAICHVTVTEKCSWGRRWNRSAKCCQDPCQDPGGCVWGLSLSRLWHTLLCVGHCWAVSVPSAELDVSFPSHRDPLLLHWPAQLLSSRCFALQRTSLALEQSGGSLCSANSPFLLPFLTFPLCALKGKYKKPNSTWEQPLSSCCSQCQGCTWQLCTPAIPTPALPAPGYRGGSHAIQCVCSIYFSGRLWGFSNIPSTYYYYF